MLYDLISVLVDIDNINEITININKINIIYWKLQNNIFTFSGGLHI